MGMRLINSLLLVTLLFGCKEGGTTEPKDNEPLLNEITEIGDSTKIEIVTWNIERFPKNDISDEYLTEIFEGLDADIYLVQEIQSRSTFGKVIGDLEEYEFFLKNNNTGLSLGIVYKSDFVKLINNKEILSDSSTYFASRPPLLTNIEWRKDNITKNLSLINLHYKCCGDDSISYVQDDDGKWDEEFRRLRASQLLYDYINANLLDDNVIVAGDWNDAIQEPKNTNTFQVFIDDSTNYKFVDMGIAESGEENWSWQGWSSSYPAIHFDHILINKNLFDEFDNNSIVNTIKIEEYFENGSSEYDNNVSDHRPVSFKFVP